MPSVLKTQTLDSLPCFYKSSGCLMVSPEELPPTFRKAEWPSVRGPCMLHLAHLNITVDKDEMQGSSHSRLGTWLFSLDLTPWDSGIIFREDRDRSDVKTLGCPVGNISLQVHQINSLSDACSRKRKMLDSRHSAQTCLMYYYISCLCIVLPLYKNISRDFFFMCHSLVCPECLWRGLNTQ